MRDKVVYGMTVGLLADVVKLLVNYLGYLFNFTDQVFWQIVASRFLEKHLLQRPVAYVVGGIADLAVASFLGVAFVYLLTFTGWRFIYLKGCGFAILVWVFLFGTLLSQSIHGFLPPAALLLTAVAHFVFGLGLAFFTVRLRKIRLHD
ncbi:hypothetical protein [Capillibacterium thermochitinicola]|uniref:Uncharacterized protein n=1 Tax=Capillibacterium thermochitinicola TaxID=2699427 RepID=A0A8J6HYJ4_9FIRM|nr:hypothetical protein [Capillibacterium thermochitinicola]MBA2133932.1 hypothetical protein [Capillibacterium thermochitinicola]